jgi:hypothetical protein
MLRNSYTTCRAVTGTVAKREHRTKPPGTDRKMTNAKTRRRSVTKQTRIEATPRPLKPPETSNYSSAILFNGTSHVSLLQRYLPKADVPERLKNGRG